MMSTTVGRRDKKLADQPARPELMQRPSSKLLIGFALLIFPAAGAQPGPIDKGADNQPIAGIRLRDCLGGWHSLEDFRGCKALVIAFVGTECPLAKLYAARLAELAREFETKGVVFLGVDSNRRDSEREVAEFARTHGISFPVLMDADGVLAGRVGVTRMTEVVVLDPRRAVRYRGRIDDQYGVDYVRPKPTRRDLAVALNEILDNNPVTEPALPAAGCLISPTRERPGVGPVTYSNQIARIIQKHCVTCHRPGEAAPFPLTTFAEVDGWAETIGEVVQEGRMPPWRANPAHGAFKNDRRLSGDEKKLLAEWVQGGAQEGDPKDLPEPARFVEGWRIPTPDAVLTMPESFKVPAKGVVAYKYYTIDPGFKEDKYIKASDARPGARSVVHHILAFVVPPGAQGIERGGDLMAASIPGVPPQLLPEGTAVFLPAGSRIVVQVHYSPNGTEQTDLSRIGLVFAEPKAVTKILKTGWASNMELRIPARASDYQVESTGYFFQDSLLYGVMPHMHLRGKSFRTEAVYPDKTKEILLDVPRYNFNWQDNYEFVIPKSIAEGTVLRCEGHFDNSKGNRSNPDPDVEVTWGEQTWDEMMIGFFGYTQAEQDLRLGAPTVKRAGDDEYEVTFRYPAPKEGKEVYLAGTFNEWAPSEHKMDGPDGAGMFTTRLILKSGEHQYKFVVDGKRWRSDPGNPRQVEFWNNSAIILGPH
jgi:peroxiredoxin/mono/diheme cytochrome c family protein